MRVAICKTKFCDLPETISPEDYAKWRGIGIAKARERFNAVNFPRIDGIGTKLIADKRAVLLYDLGMNKSEAKDLYNDIAKEIALSIKTEREVMYERNTTHENNKFY